jgi:polyhydroxyalkanoate synthesis repressor PhaR
MAQTEERKSAPITIKKYANRRLYNTATSSYVTLDDLCQMVKQGIEFTVYDAKTGDDITRPVLTQIIVEEEGKGQNLLPITVLRQLIGFYGDSLQGLVPHYLEQSMQSFIHNQERMRQYVQSTLGGIFPFTQFEEMGKQNMTLLEQAMKMFSPFGADPGAAPAEPGTPPASAEAPDKLDELQKKIDALEKQMENLGRQKRD